MGGGGGVALISRPMPISFFIRNALCHAEGPRRGFPSRIKLDFEYFRWNSVGRINEWHIYGRPCINKVTDSLIVVPRRIC